MPTDRLGRAAIALLGVLALSLTIGPAAALAEDDRVRLALLPVNQPGPYFDVTMRPGEQRTLSVDLADMSSVELTARTYAADVYTIVNGGFGGRLRGEARTAMTAWLDYPEVVLDLEPGQRLRRSFTVRIPTDAGPGEYITSIVLENDASVRGDGSLAMDQVVRQAVAVVVTVPGPRVPVLTVGGATHHEVAGRSVVSVAVANPGNIRLKPAVEFALTNAAGAQVSQATIQMDTFYAWTETFIEVPLAARLLPGDYTIRLSLLDEASGAAAGSTAIPLTVEAAAAAATADGAGALLTPIDQGSGPGGSGLIPILVALVGGALIAIAIGGVVVTWRRRHGRRPG